VFVVVINLVLKLLLQVRNAACTALANACLASPNRCVIEEHAAKPSL
jgi:hypothetical protein